VKAKEEGQGKMELDAIWKVIRKRLWLVTLMALVAGASAFCYAQQQVEQYSSSTTLYLNSGIPDITYASQSLSAVRSLAQTYIQFMRTSRFGELVAAKLDPAPPPRAVLGSLQAEWLQDSQFFQITATDQNPETAQALANAAADVLIAENIARLQQQAKQAAALQEPRMAARLEQLDALQASVLAELDLADDRIKSLEAGIAELEALPPSEDGDRKLLLLRSDLGQQQSRRASLFSTLAQTTASLTTAGGTTSSFVVETAVVIDPAPLPMRPLPRGTGRSVMLAVLAAAALGVGLTFLLEYMDWTVKTPEELDALYGSGALGVVSVMRGTSGGTARPAQPVTLARPRSTDAEAYRSLRTNIRFASPGREVKSILVTSAAPLEGKSTTAANLAVVLAQGGRRVIAVDADLRRPALHSYFGMENRQGLTDLIVDDGTDVEAVLQPTAQANLWLVSAGQLPRNPAELLGSERCAEVMEKLEKQADFVVYDSAPAGTVTDAVLLASRVDGVIHVVKAGGSRRDVVVRVKGMLEKAGGHVLGPVLNLVQRSDMGYYQYYYHDYYQPKEAAQPQSPADAAAAKEQGLPAVSGEGQAAAAAAVAPALRAHRRRRKASWWRALTWAGLPWLVGVLGWAAGIVVGAVLCYLLRSAVSGAVSSGAAMMLITAPLLGLIAGALGGLATGIGLRRAGSPVSGGSLLTLAGGWTAVWVAGQLILVVMETAGVMNNYGWVAWSLYGALVGAAGGMITGQVMRQLEPGVRMADVATGWGGAFALSGALAFILRLNGLPNALSNPAAAGANGWVGLLVAVAVGSIGGAIGGALMLRELRRARGWVV